MCFVKFEQKPQTFDGIEIDVQDYFVQFEAVSQWNHWSELEKASQLVISLRGEARTILRLLTQAQLESYFFLKNLLLQRFNPKERIAFHKFQLRNCQILANESMVEFGHRFKLLGHRAYPNNFHEMQPYFLHIYECCLEAEMAKFVHFKHPQSLDHAISLAIEFESFILTEKPPVIYRKVGMHKGKGFRKWVKRRRKPKLCFFCSKPNHVRAKCPERRLKVSKVSGNKVKNVTTRIFKSNYSEPVLCVTCGCVRVSSILECKVRN